MTFSKAKAQGIRTFPPGSIASWGCRPKATAPKEGTAMQQTIFAIVAFVVVGLSEPTYALTRDDCQRVGGAVAPSNRLQDFKCCSPSSRLNRETAVSGTRTNLHQDMTCALAQRPKPEFLQSSSV